MAKIPYADEQPMSKEVEEILEIIPAKLNIFRMVANAETNFRPFLSLGSSILAKQQLDAKIRELAILHVANILGGKYEHHQHVPIAKGCGATDAEIEAVDAGNLDADCFNPAERAALLFAGDVCSNTRASDENLAAVKEWFSPREIVELILTVGFYSTVAMLCETTGVDIDAAVDMKVVEAARDME